MSRQAARLLGLLGLTLGAAPAGAETITALTADNRLLTFDSETPGTVNAMVDITGLRNGENAVAMDYRPASDGTGTLFVATVEGGTGRLYTVDLSTGAATQVVSTALVLPDHDYAVAGTHFDLDFNPSVDRLRFTSVAGNNLRLHPAPGNSPVEVATDSDLAFAATDANAGVMPTICAAAYSNNVQGARRTTLYGIDVARGLLVRQGALGGGTGDDSPNAGLLHTIGSLGLGASLSNQAGLDISGATGTAYAVLITQGTLNSRLFTVNLATGAATAVGAVGNNLTVLDIAVVRGEPNRGDVPMYLVTRDRTLRVISTDAPGTAVTTTTLTGQDKDELNGVDVRPATGELIMFSNLRHIRRVNTSTGAIEDFAPFDTNVAPATHYGVDFNPAADRLRIVSNVGGNYRVALGTGEATLTTDTALSRAPGDPLTGVAPELTAVAYDRSATGLGATTMYGIDSAADVLVLQGAVNGGMGADSPNGGVLTTVGGLGVDLGPDVTLEISPANGLAYAAALHDTALTLYRINLQNGAAIQVGTLPGTSPAVGLTTIPRGNIQFAMANVTVREDAGTVTLRLERVAGSTGAIAVPWATAVGTATDTDFTTVANGLAMFASGELTKDITVNITFDSDGTESDETFTVRLEPPTGGAGLVGGASVATVTIQNVSPTSTSSGTVASSAAPASSGLPPSSATSAAPASSMGGASSAATSASLPSSAGTSAMASSNGAGVSSSGTGAVSNGGDGGEGDENAARGCGCQASSAEPAAGGLLVLALAGLWLRRGRRTR